MMSRTLHTLVPYILVALFFFGMVQIASAATLRLTPDTGVYSAGGTFTTRVVINTAGKPVNAAEGQLSFNPKELSVVNVSRSSSIFNLWTQEPSHSNSGGIISFGGGSPSGYTGSAGTVMSITFRALNAGNPKVTFSNGSVLAADGLGTNVLTSMQGGSYTVAAPADNPAPEYIAPANTPSAPNVKSTSHPDSDGWYGATTAELSWTLPSGVTSIRTLLDENAGTIPTIVYDEPVSSKTIEGLEDGVSYFHIQFRNSDGWGKVTHYRLGVDTQPPSKFIISESEEYDPANPERIFKFDVEDISPVTRFLIQTDGGEAVEYIDEEATGTYTLPSLPPGRHSLIVEAFDSAGHSLISTYAFDVTSFDRPVFTEYPTRLNSEVIPVFKGTTRPNSSIAIGITSTAGVGETYSIESDAEGNFIFIPDSRFDLGVYDIIAVATDEYGAQSDPSETIRIIVEEPGFVRIGSYVISLLSILVPLGSLVLLLLFGLWYLWHRLFAWRKRVRKETKEAEYKLAVEFDAITSHLGARIAKLKKSRKGKLTKAEEELINEMKTDIDTARDRIRKEIEDIEDIVK